MIQIGPWITSSDLEDAFFGLQRPDAEFAILRRSGPPDPYQHKSRRTRAALEGDHLTDATKAPDTIQTCSGVRHVDGVCGLRKAVSVLINTCDDDR
jgi:hypothetical protein